VQCFTELIQFFTEDPKLREMIRRLMLEPPQFLETLLNTIDPHCTNQELTALAGRGSPAHRDIVKRFAESHPGDRRDRETLKSRRQWDHMRSGKVWRSRDDDDAYDHSYDWMDDYPGDGEWVWGMDPDRLRWLAE
jgi:hypothetical protein